MRFEKLFCVNIWRINGITDRLQKNFVSSYTASGDMSGHKQNSNVGGKETVIGTFTGTMLIAVLCNGLNLINVSSYIQQIVVGVVILFATMLDMFGKEA